MTKPSLAKTSLRVLSAIFLFAFVAFLVVTIMATSKIVIMIFTIITAISFALLLTSLVLSYFYNLGDRKMDEGLASNLFGSETKITK